MKTTYQKLRDIIESPKFLELKRDDITKIYEIFDAIDSPSTPADKWNPKQSWIEHHLFPRMVGFVDKKYNDLVVKK